MPRNYKRKQGARTYADYSVAKLNEVLQNTRSGEISQREAEKQYKISHSTLIRKLHGKYEKPAGGQATLDNVTENLIKEHVISCSTYGFPLDGFDMRCLIKTHLDRNGMTVSRFKDNFPGRGWFKCFLKRHPDLIERMASNIKKKKQKYWNKLSINTLTGLKKRQLECHNHIYLILMKQI